VKLLDQSYTLDKSRQPIEYRLRRGVDAKAMNKVVAVIQKGATQAYADGLINQISPKRQLRFFASPIDLLAHAALLRPHRTLFVLRRFTGEHCRHFHFN
jgi:hypothetical protein